MKRVHELGGKIWVANFADHACQIVGDLLDRSVLTGALDNLEHCAMVLGQQFLGAPNAF